MAIDEQLQSPLFALPREVRESIYGHLLAFRYADFEHTTRPDHLFLGETSYARPLPPAMLASKRLYHELAPYVHNTAALRVCMSEYGRRVGFAVHGTLRPERLARLHLLVAMEHANWNAWLRFTREVVRRAGGALEELVVDWEPRTSARGERGGKPARGFMAQHEQRMEERFFEVVGGIENLKTVRVYGDVPGYWITALGGRTGARVVHVKGRWWREDEQSADRGPTKLTPKYHEVYSMACRV